MRLVSNKESVARGEVSVLAIAETLLAIAAVFYLSTHFNTLRWLAFAMCVSPLLLLRTDESTQLGVRLLRQWLAPLNKRFQRSRPLWAEVIVTPMFLLAFCLVSFVARTVATIHAAFRAPAQFQKTGHALLYPWIRVSLLI